MGKHGEVYRGYVTLHKIVHFYDGSRTVISRACKKSSSRNQSALRLVPRPPRLRSHCRSIVYQLLLPDRCVCVCSSLPFVTVYAPIIYRMPTHPGVIVVVVIKNRRTIFSAALALSLLVSRVGLADNVQVSVMSLAGLSSNNLQIPKFRTTLPPIAKIQSKFKPTLQCSHLFLTEL